MKSLITILLGSNLGDRLQKLESAHDLLAEIFADHVKASSVYMSSAWGKTDQPDFLNQVVSFYTGLKPRQVLDVLLSTEHILGRDRTGILYEPRTIDIDLLYFGDLIMHEHGLTVPHPAIADRRFTLEPLTEIYPDMIHPVHGKTHRELLTLCTDPGTVQRFGVNA